MKATKTLVGIDYQKTSSAAKLEIRQKLPFDLYR